MKSRAQAFAWVSAVATDGYPCMLRERCQAP
jgi:hypothetical protein